MFRVEPSRGGVRRPWIEPVGTANSPIPKKEFRVKELYPPGFPGKVEPGCMSYYHGSFERSSCLLSAVRRVLGSYADRGVFRAFVEEPPRRGRHGFRFLWLKREPMRLTYEPARETVAFPRLLEGVGPRSPVWNDVRRFLAARTSRSLPRHRRIDPKRIEIQCTRRKRVISIGLRAKRGESSYAARRLVNLVHELFVMLRDAHPEYEWAQLDGSQE